MADLLNLQPRNVRNVRTLWQPREANIDASVLLRVRVGDYACQSPALSPAAGVPPDGRFLRRQRPACYTRHCTLESAVMTRGATSLSPMFTHRIVWTVCLALYGCESKGHNSCPEIYMRESSPDGRYEIVVCRFPQRGAMMPGQSSDAPGVIQLRRRDTDAVVYSTPIEAVAAMPLITWNGDTVSLPTFVDWPLTPAPKE